MSTGTFMRCKHCVGWKNGSCPMIFCDGDDDDEIEIDHAPSDGEGYCSASCSWEGSLELPFEWDETGVEVVECRECVYHHTDQCPKRYCHPSGNIEDYAYDEGFCYKGQRREVK